MGSYPSRVAPEWMSQPIMSTLLTQSREHYSQSSWGKSPSKMLRSWEMPATPRVSAPYLHAWAIASMCTKGMQSLMPLITTIKGAACQCLRGSSPTLPSTLMLELWVLCVSSILLETSAQYSPPRGGRKGSFISTGFQPDHLPPPMKEAQNLRSE